MKTILFICCLCFSSYLIQAQTLTHLYGMGKYLVDSPDNYNLRELEVYSFDPNEGTYISGDTIIYNNFDTLYYYGISSNRQPQIQAATYTPTHKLSELIYYSNISNGQTIPSEKVEYTYHPFHDTIESFQEYEYDITSNSFLAKDGLEIFYDNSNGLIDSVQNFQFDVLTQTSVLDNTTYLNNSQYPDIIYSTTIGKTYINSIDTTATAYDSTYSNYHYASLSKLALLTTSPLLESIRMEKYTNQAGKDSILRYFAPALLSTQPWILTFDGYYAYNALNQLTYDSVKNTPSIPNFPPPNFIIHEYTYNGVNNLTEIIERNGTTLIKRINIHYNAFNLPDTISKSNLDANGAWKINSCEVNFYSPIDTALMLDSFKYLLPLEISPIKVKSENIVSIFPNPINSLINIQIEDATLGNYNSYAIFDLKGNNIKSGLINQKHTKISTLEIPSGTYLITVKGKKTQTKNIVISN
jgi:hypothetical protein